MDVEPGHHQPGPARPEKRAQHECGGERPGSRGEAARPAHERDEKDDVPREGGGRHGARGLAEQDVDGGGGVEEAGPGLVDLEARLGAEPLAALGREARVELHLGVGADLERLESAPFEREAQDRRKDDRERRQPGVAGAQEESGDRTAPAQHARPACRLFHPRILPNPHLSTHPRFRCRATAAIDFAGSFTSSASPSPAAYFSSSSAARGSSRSVLVQRLPVSTPDIVPSIVTSFGSAVVLT